MIMSPTLLAALLFIPLFFILVERTRRCNTQKKPLPPSPPGLPFIGNLLELGSLHHRSLFHLAKKYGPLVLLHIGSIPTLVVSSPHLAKEFLKTHDPIFADRPSLKGTRVIMYNNKNMAFLPYGENWRQIRKVCVVHLLSPKMVQSLSSVRAEEVAQLLKRITAHTGSGICLTKMLEDLLTNVLFRAVLGSSLNDERGRLICNMMHQSSPFYNKVYVEDIFPRFAWLDRILGWEDKLRRHSQKWDAILDELIRDHSIKISTDQSNSTTFLDVLLQLNKDSSTEFFLTKEHIKANLLDIIEAGIYTSSTTIDWSMVELIRNPNVMKQARDEVRLIANGDDTIKEELMPKMTYLKATIKEVLRLHPPSPLLLYRESTQDCEIEGYHIPKQTTVIINAWALGQDEVYWETPEEFRPERFLGTTVDYKGRDFEFIPFGAGRRICPAISFAIASIELVLANILNSFDWRLPNGLTIEDMDMEECPGLITSRKQNLDLVPTPANKVN